MRMLFYISFLLLTANSSLNAQLTYTQKAITAYQLDKHQAAREYSDTAIISKSEKDDPQTWYSRGVIYYTAYKKEQTSQDNTLRFRDESETAFRKVLEIDTQEVYTDKSRTALYNIAKTYNNDMVRLLNDKEFMLAEDQYNKYRELTSVAKPQSNLKKKDIEFYNALGSIINTTYDNNKSADSLWYMAEEVYAKVLGLDSNNVIANYSYALLYYNRGVDLINGLDDDASLDEIFRVQEQTAELFRQSLPYMLKAYEHDPGNIETLIGLEGIAYDLNQPDKVTYWREKQKELLGAEKWEEWRKQFEQQK